VEQAKPREAIGQQKTVVMLSSALTLVADGVHGSVEFPGTLRDGVECDWKCVGNQSQGMRLAVA
jgi:hypothetical protein